MRLFFSDKDQTMARHTLPLTFLFPLLILALCPVAHAQCPAGGLAVVVNKSASVESLSMAQLRKLILGDVRNWPDQKPVVLVLREPSSNIAQCVLSKIVRLTDAEYRRYIMNAEFRGEEVLTVQSAGSDPQAARIVAGTASSIAVIDAGAAPAAASAVKIVRVNGKLPGEPGYPM
jgi:ABC-type phosphate transport system substrate-binding protein